MNINPNWDTIIVPSKVDNFNKVFLEEKRWYGIYINPLISKQLKYIAVYQSSPVSAITHWAVIDKIVNTNTEIKWLITFKNESEAIGPISNKRSFYGVTRMIIGPRYTNLELLKKANHFVELFDK